MNISAGLYDAPKTENPSIVPLPKSSRTAPIIVSAPVKPSPILIPSSALGSGEFLAAKLSARARIMQLTTISGTNIPSDWESAGKYAFKSISIIDTNVAIITMYAAILILFGITFLTSEITKFEHIRTNVAERPIPIELLTEVVTAKVGHIPRS